MTALRPLLLIWLMAMAAQASLADGIDRAHGYSGVAPTLRAVAASDSYRSTAPPLRAAIKTRDYAVQAPLLRAVTQTRAFQARAPALRAATRTDSFSATAPTLRAAVRTDAYRVSAPALRAVTKTDRFVSTAPTLAIHALDERDTGRGNSTSATADIHPDGLLGHGENLPGFHLLRCIPLENYAIDLQRRTDAGENTDAEERNLVSLISEASVHMFTGRADLWCDQITAGLP